MDLGSGPEGYMWQGGVLTMLTGIAEARFINDAGVIVGKDAAGRWVAYDPKVGHTVLLDPETGFSQPVVGVTDLDERGRILGFVELGATRNGFLLTPTVTTVTPTTPIPGAVWLLGSGLVGLMGWRRRQRTH